MQKGSKHIKVDKDTSTLYSPCGWSKKVDVELLNNGGLETQVYNKLFGATQENVIDGSLNLKFETRARIGVPGIEEPVNVLAMIGRFNANTSYFVVNERRLIGMEFIEGGIIYSSLLLSGDGKTLVTIESKMDKYWEPESTTVVVRNVDSGAELQKFKHDKPVSSSCLSGDGKTLVTVESKVDSYRVPLYSTVLVRNVDSGAQLQKFDHEKPVTSSSLSGDGTTLVVSEGKKVVVRSVKTGVTLQEFEHENRVTDSCLSGDGKTLVTVEHGKLYFRGPPEGDAIVTVRNVDTGAKLHEFESEQVVTSSSLSGDGKSLVTVEHGELPESGRTITIRNVDTGTTLQEFTSEQAVTSSSLSGDGKSLVTVEHGKLFGGGHPRDDSTITIRNVDTGTKQEFTSKQAVTSSSLSEDGKTLVVVEDKRKVIVRNVHTGAELQKFEGKTLVTVEDRFRKSTVIIRSAETGAQLQKFKHDKPVSSSCLSGDGKSLLTVEHGKINGHGRPTGDATVTVRNVDTGAKLQEFESEQAVTSSSLSGDGKSLVTVESKEVKEWYDWPLSSTVLVRNVDTGAKLQKFDHEKPVTSSSLSGDGKSLVTVESKVDEYNAPLSSTVLVRNVDSGAQLQKFDHEKPVTSSSLSGDGKTLVYVEQTKVYVEQTKVYVEQTKVIVKHL